MVYALIVLALGITFIVWQLYKKKVAPDAANVAPNTPKADFGPLPPVARGKPPTDPAVTGVVLGTATEGLLGGKPVSNGPQATGTWSPVSDSSVLAVDGQKYRTPAGVRVFTMPVETGRTYKLETADSYALVTVTVTKPDGSMVKADVSGGGYANVVFVAQETGFVNVSVASDKEGGIERHVA